MLEISKMLFPIKPNHLPSVSLLIKRQLFGQKGKSTLDAQIEKTSIVVSVERTLIILNLLANNLQELGTREIGHTLRYSVSVVQKILNTLRMQNVINKKLNTDKYVLVIAALRLAQTFISQADLLKVTRPFLGELASITGETAFLGACDGMTTVYLDKVVSKQELRLDIPPGVSRPLNATGLGQLLLAYADEDLIPELVRTNAIERKTETTITDPDKLRKRIASIIRQKYVHVSGEYSASASA
jgi:DNA-binding IclR family transcriptional regulator